MKTVIAYRGRRTASDGQFKECPCFSFWGASVHGAKFAFIICSSGSFAVARYLSLHPLNRMTPRQSARNIERTFAQESSAVVAASLIVTVKLEQQPTQKQWQRVGSKRLIIICSPRRPVLWMGLYLASQLPTLRICTARHCCSSGLDTSLATVAGCAANRSGLPSRLKIKMLLPESLDFGCSHNWLPLVRAKS